MAAGIAEQAHRARVLLQWHNNLNQNNNIYMFKTAIESQ
jgi:hypothetical protein